MHAKRLALELVLAISAQRGSLHYLLEWVDLALKAAGAEQENAAGSQENKACQISHDTFLSIVRQMKKTAVCA